MSYVLKTKYRWKELSSDGLLKEPKTVGPYYDDKDINGYDGGYDYKVDAMNTLLELKNSYPYEIPSSLILIEVVQMVPV